MVFKIQYEICLTNNGALGLAPPFLNYLTTSLAVKNKGFAQLSAVLDSFITFYFMAFPMSC